MKILITGDFCPIHRAANIFEGNDIFGDFNSIISECDLNITNLECPLTEASTPINKTGPTLKSSFKYAKFLKDSKFDLVTMANNHIMDYGAKGIEETITALNNNSIDYVGAGKSTDEIAIIYKTIKGIKIAFVNVCENEWSTDERGGYKANGFSEIESFYTIKKAKQNADYVVLIHHGGHEMYNLPSPRLKSVLRYFVDCGADVVINHHTHCVGGHEVYNQKPIFYSLGNFVFDNPNQRDSIWNYGMAVTLNFSKDNFNFTIDYFEQFNKNASLRVVKESDLPYSIDEVNRIIQDDELLKTSFESFINEKRKLFNSFIEPVSSKYYNALKNRGLLPSLWSKKKKEYLKNLISCESHREILQEILKEETVNT
ncbi:hypothetical protein GCM10007424_10060 [Flavobacterium suaedae]|uniref:Capsule synthesis protein CapA domain-containing protein n=1 Tax=Flavobacterium suaedae TaxID=1767027 RepID=A0ABQ1JQF5_9FLAO|nr:CapA family protein [Flavobacterium suaedae]GGB72066.1 hypothetical protein GCM10007424_10060 [Flavobacterium suaedae]